MHILTLIRLFNVVLNLIVLLAMTDIIGPDEYYIIPVALAYAGLLSPVIDLGLNNTIIRYSKRNENLSFVSTLLYYRVLVLLLFVILMLAFDMPAYISVVFFMAFYEANFKLIQKILELFGSQKKLKQLFLVNLLLPTVLLFSINTGFTVDKYFDIMLLVLISTNFLLLGFYYFIKFGFQKNIKCKQFKSYSQRVYKSTGFYFVNSFASYALLRIDVILINAFFDGVFVSNYSIAQRIVNTMMITVQSLISINISNILIGKRLIDSGAYKILKRNIFIISALIFITVEFFIHDAVIYIFNIDYIGVVEIVQIYVLLVFVKSQNILYSYMVDLSNRPQSKTRSLLGSLLIMIGLIVLLSGSSTYVIVAIIISFLYLNNRYMVIIKKEYQFK
jgi:O-antigen/teichoic acid export membrane protein